jgi:hypothetical protein
MRRLVLNDVGPTHRVGGAAAHRQLCGPAGALSSVEQAAATLRLISAGFGPHTDAEWWRPDRAHAPPCPTAAWACTTTRRSACPAGHDAGEAEQGEALLWQLYDQIKAQTLLLRGASPIC